MKTKIEKADLITRVTSHFSAANYTIQTQTESSIVLQGGKDINWPLMILLIFCTGLIGALIYWLVAKTNQVVVNYTASDGYLDIAATGNTNKAQALATSFISSLPAT